MILQDTIIDKSNGDLFIQSAIPMNQSKMGRCLMSIDCFSRPF